MSIYRKKLNICSVVMLLAFGVCIMLGMNSSAIADYSIPAEESDHIEKLLSFAEEYTLAPIVEVDSIRDEPEGRTVTVHCYEIVEIDDGAHTATWDWISYNLDTGECSDFLGNQLDIDGVLIKDQPQKGDLIKDKTFYARILKNRYGGNCDEGDYAAGKFLLWAVEVELSGDGDFAYNAIYAVPYIVSDDGNKENLSLLSGGNDGDKPYGDEIWMLKTDEDGEIIDAVAIYCSPKFTG